MTFKRRTLCSVALLAAACRRSEPPAAMPHFDPKGPKVFELMVADRSLQKRLLYGFYEGSEGWRWTARRFALALDVPPPADADAILELDFSAPVELMNEIHSVTVSARVNGTGVGHARYSREGRY